MPGTTRQALSTKKSKPRYRFGRKIGGGGMGEVRLATVAGSDDGDEGSRVAVKQLASKWLPFPEAVERFTREVSLQRRLDHPNVVPILGKNLSATQPWFAMPLASGNLNDEIPHHGMALAEVITATGSVLAGVAHAHARGVVHRDLKPLNVLRFGDLLKVSDFGLGKDLARDATELTRTGQQMGTDPFMAPEQFDDPKNVGKPADVYAIGKMVCQMSTGKTPPTGTFSLEGVPRELHYFIAKCCATDPARRYADAGEALKGFRALLSTDEDEEDEGDVADVIHSLIKDAHGLLRNGDPADLALDALLARLLRNSDNSALYLDVVPKMHGRVLTAMLSGHLPEYSLVLSAYDELVAGSLKFEYCDIVAGFYQKVWDATDNLAIRERLLRRLVRMGAAHNRYFVRDVVVKMLSSVSDSGTATMAAHTIDDEAADAAWHAADALAAQPPKKVAQALRRSLT